MLCLFYILYFINKYTDYYILFYLKKNEFIFTENDKKIMKENLNYLKSKFHKDYLNFPVILMLDYKIILILKI